MKIIIYLVCCLLVNTAYSQTLINSKIPNQVRRESTFGSDSEEINKSLARDGIAHVIVELKIDSELSTIASDSQLTARKSKIKDVQSNVLERVFGGVSQAAKASGFDRGLRQFDITPMIAITVDSAELERFVNDPDVIRIHLDALGEPQLQNSVPLIGMTGDNGAYQLGATGQGQAVAVLDTGVQVSHPFLTGKTIAEACFSNAAGANISLCPNGQKSQIGAGSAEATTPSCVNGQEYLCSHGTHVSGIAVGSNPVPGIPPNGVAKDAKLVAVQVFTRFNDANTCGNEGAPCVRTYTSDQIAALEWVYANKNSLFGGTKIASVNMSLGGGVHSSACDNDPRKASIDLLRLSGIATTVSSGNDGYIYSVSDPACISTAVTVGATTLSDQVALFSNENQYLVDLLAPGVSILSSVPFSAYAQYSGTSMAAPHVAGAFAAIKSRLPDATVDQVETALKNTGVNIPNYTNTYTKPRIQVNAALSSLGVSSWNLNVIKVGNGTVTSTPAGINCGATCSANYASGTSVTLSQTAADGYPFIGWGGACSGTGTCTVIMDSVKNVTATFAQPKTLTVAKTGNGTITSIPARISCGSTCSAQFIQGTSVSLIAQPDYGFAFTAWSGACGGTGTCVVTMDADKSASANFIELPKYPVKITKPSTGVISSEPAGIFCGGRNRQCSSSFSSAKLTATPNPGYEFIRWTGCQAPEGNICYIKPTGKMTVKPVFKKLPKFNLKVTKNNLGSVISSPAGLKCPDKKRSCSVKFIKGTQVTLTAAPQAGRSFVGWTGACSGTDPCAFLMDGNKGVGASFQ